MRLLCAGIVQTQTIRLLFTYGAWAYFTSVYGFSRAWQTTFCREIAMYNRRLMATGWPFVGNIKALIEVFMKRALGRAVVAAAGWLGLGIFAVCAPLAAQTVAAPDAAKGQTLYNDGDAARGIIACMTCHGAAGNSTIPVNPNLAAQPHEYLAKQLHAFQSKDGAAPLRNGANGAPTVMGPMVLALTDEDVRNLAFYLTQQALDLETAATATQEATMERGQQIWRAGIPERRVAACAACHAANGAGIPAQYPRLAGQFPDYIAEQLRLFRSGDRVNDVMHEIADRMNDADIAAVADYAAGLR